MREDPRDDRGGLARVARLIAHDPEKLRQTVVAAYEKRFPHDRDKMPVQSTRAMVWLVPTLRWLCTQCPTGVLTSHATDTLFQLGQEFTRYGISTDHWPIAADIIADAVHDATNIDRLTTLLLRDALAMATNTMVEGAQQRLSSGAPLYRTARVVEVQRRCRRVSVIRAETDEDYYWHPGQFIAVSSPMIRGIWRYLCPSIPYSAGQIEFHVKTTDVASPTGILASSKPGDEIYLGDTFGTMSYTDETKDLLFIAHGTGLAPLRAMLIDLCNQEHNRRVHLFFGADYPGELYDLRTLWQIASHCPWLQVTPVTDHDRDDYWVSPTEQCTAPFGLHLRQTGQIGKIVSSYGSWEDRDIFVAGNPTMVSRTIDSLVAGGTPRAAIQHNPLS